jgi:hypothetical protein
LTAKITVHSSKTEGGKTLNFVPAGLCFHKRINSYNKPNKLTKSVIPQYVTCHVANKPANTATFYLHCHSVLQNSNFVSLAEDQIH